MLGFCFGGGLAFAVAARAEAKPDVLVSYYGSALPDLLALAPQVTVPSLHHFGEADAYIPLDTVREIERAVTATNDAVTFETYAGAGHAFDNPSPMFHHAEASQAAWATTTAWLAEHLPVRRGGRAELVGVRCRLVAVTLGLRVARRLARAVVVGRWARRRSGRRRTAAGRAGPR